MPRNRHPKKVTTGAVPVVPHSLMEAWLLNHPDQTIEDWDRLVQALPAGKGLFLKNGQVFVTSAERVIQKLVQARHFNPARFAAEDPISKGLHR